MFDDEVSTTEGYQYGEDQKCARIGITMLLILLGTYGGIVTTAFCLYVPWSRDIMIRFAQRVMRYLSDCLAFLARSAENQVNHPEGNVVAGPNN